MDGQFIPKQPMQMTLSGRGFISGISGPQIVTTATSGATNGSPANINLPGSLVAGRFLVVIVGYAQNAGMTTPASWDLVGTVNTGGTGSNRRMSVFSKVSDGLEGATLAVTQTGTPSNWGATTWQISGATTASMAGAFIDASGGDPDPPSLDMLSSAPTLWLAAGIKRQTPLFTSAPAGYSGLSTILGGASNMSWMSAWKSSVGQIEDPGTFTPNTISDSWAAATVGVR